MRLFDLRFYGALEVPDLGPRIKGLDLFDLGQFTELHVEPPCAPM